MQTELNRKKTCLLVEDAIVFVDVCNISFLLVEALPREFTFLVNAKRNVSVENIGRDQLDTYSWLILLTTRSMASSEGLLSP